MNYEIQIVSIEGNIGSGKSTLLSNLKEHFRYNNNIIFLKEPLDEWSKIKDENGLTILEKFYSDQEKYSFPFQMMAYVSRLKLLKNTIKDIEENIKNMWMNFNYKTSLQRKIKYIVITERCLLTDKMVFAKMLYDSGKIESVNYQIYLNWFDTFSEEYNVNKVIYVKTKPEVCHERICKRDRNGEDKIPLDYLNNCDIYHNNMLDKSSSDCICNDQLIINGDIDIYANESTLEEWIASVEKFIA
jgi:deoxyadenosine/deoxycytidine kinase